MLPESPGPHLVVVPCLAVTLGIKQTTRLLHHRSSQPTMNSTVHNTAHSLAALLGASLLLSCGGSSGATPASLPDQGDGNTKWLCQKDADCTQGVCVSGSCQVTTTCGNPVVPSTLSFNAGDCSTETAFEPTGTGNYHVASKDGALVLQATTQERSHIWIVNTHEATVSKIDTATKTELARYRTGRLGGVRAGNTGDDPSRTAVDAFGDAYIANRQGRSVVKVSSQGTACPDKVLNAQTTITQTSSSPTDVKSWNQDKCVLWSRYLDGGGPLRGIASHNVIGLDGVLENAVWVAGYDGVLWKLDANTGEILLQTPTPTLQNGDPIEPYGMAMDRSGNLWMATRQFGYLGRLDTTRCMDGPSCDVATCVSPSQSDNHLGDDCIKQALRITNFHSYGITIDQKQRLWFGGYNVTRYDPGAAPNARVTQLTTFPWTPPSGFDDVIHGIAVDDQGWVWGAGLNEGVLRIHADDPTGAGKVHRVTGTQGFSNKGIAVDGQGKVWSITRDQTALVIQPGATITNNTVDSTSVQSLNEPYTYSDMTGLQHRLATQAYGVYRTTFEHCEKPERIWSRLHWNAAVPPNTRLVFRARTAIHWQRFTGVPWVTIATVTDANPVGDAELTSHLPSIGISNGKEGMEPWLEVEVQLQRLDGASPNATPALNWLEITGSCNDAVI